MAPRLTRRSALVLLLAAAVLFAGCTGPGGDEPQEPQTNDTTDDEPDIRVTPTDGISVSFRSLSDTYLEGEGVSLQLDLTNTGQRDASSIQKRLFGASFIAGRQPYFSGKNRLSGVNKENQRPGEETTVVWRLDNPVNLDGGVKKVFPAGVRLAYTYRTDAEASFTIVPQHSYSGDSDPVNTQTTAGPLRVTTDVSTPKPVTTSDTGDTQASIPITVENVGDGAIADINGNAGRIQIERSAFQSSDATLECPESIQLSQGTRRFVCTATFPGDIFQRYLTLEMELEYPYFETVETSFQIEGLQGDQSQDVEQ